MYIGQLFALHDVLQVDVELQLEVECYLIEVVRCTLHHRRSEHHLSPPFPECGNSSPADGRKRGRRQAGREAGTERDSFLTNKGQTGSELATLAHLFALWHFPLHIVAHFSVYLIV